MAKVVGNLENLPESLLEFPDIGFALDKIAADVSVTSIGLSKESEMLL